MPVRTGYRDGEPSWADVTSPDPATSRDFYGTLFGWTFVDTGPEMGNYLMCLSGERTVAGITSAPAGFDGVPPMWSLYVATSDAAETARRIDAAGGKVLMSPMEVAGAGTMIYAFDPLGAAFGVWQAGEHTGSQLFAEPGALSWAEVYTPDGAATDAFYKAIFGYEQRQLGDGVNVDYTSWALGGDTVCGRMRMTPDYPADMPPHWMVYFAVSDVDAATQTVRELGGRVARGPADSPYGRWSTVTDPHGAAFAIVTLPPKG